MNLSEAEANYYCLQVAQGSWDNAAPELSRYAGVARRSRRWRSLHSRFGETRKEAKACQRGISVEVNRGPVSSDLLAFT